MSNRRAIDDALRIARQPFAGGGGEEQRRVAEQRRLKQALLDRQLREYAEQSAAPRKQQGLQRRPTPIPKGPEEPQEAPAAAQAPQQPQEQQRPQRQPDGQEQQEEAAPAAPAAAAGSGLATPAAPAAAAAPATVPMPMSMSRSGASAADPGEIGRRLARDLGISDIHAAAIVGHAMRESGLRGINEERPVVPGSRGGFGWLQWTGPRRTAFEQWSRENNLDPASHEANYGYMVHEIKNTPDGQRALRRFQSAQNTDQASLAFLPFLTGAPLGQEDPRAVLAIPHRQQLARQALAAIQQPPVPTNGSRVVADFAAPPVGAPPIQEVAEVPQERADGGEVGDGYDDAGIELVGSRRPQQQPRQPQQAPAPMTPMQEEEQYQRQFRERPGFYNWHRTTPRWTENQPHEGAVMAAHGGVIDHALHAAREHYETGGYQPPGLRQPPRIMADIASGGQQAMSGANRLLQGEDPRKVFRDTSVFDILHGEQPLTDISPDTMRSRLRREIPDSGMVIHPNLSSILQKHATTEPAFRAHKIIHHPELYSSFPQIRDVPVIFKNYKGGTYGAYNLPVAGVSPTDPLANGYISINRDLSDKDKKETLIHEMNHLVQQITGNPGGSSPTRMENKVKAGDPEAIKSLERAYSSIASTLSPLSNQDLEGHLFSEGNKIGLSFQQIKKITSNPRFYDAYLASFLRNSLDPTLHSTHGTYIPYHMAKDAVHDAYENALGEQEANAAIRRSGFSPYLLSKSLPHTYYKQSKTESPNTEYAINHHAKEFAGKAIMLPASITDPVIIYDMRRVRDIIKQRTGIDIPKGASVDLNGHVIPALEKAQHLV